MRLGYSEGCACLSQAFVMAAKQSIFSGRELRGADPTHEVFLSRPFVCFRNESFRCVCPCRIMGSFVASSSILRSCRAQVDTRQSLLGSLRPCCRCLCCAVPLGFTEGIWSSVCSASCLAPISFANAVVHRRGTCLIRCPPFEAFRQRPARTWESMYDSSKLQVLIFLLFVSLLLA